MILCVRAADDQHCLGCRHRIASLIDDLKKMGQATEIDGKPATALPLRFADGAVYLGMIRIGDVPALF